MVSCFLVLYLIKFLPPISNPTLFNIDLNIIGASWLVGLYPREISFTLATKSLVYIQASGEEMYL